MAGRAKRRRSSGGGRSKARVASSGLKVTAVKATAGWAATSVQVEVEAEELKREVGEFSEVRRISARIPGTSGPGASGGGTSGFSLPERPRTRPRAAGAG
jgi:hypothetical protein